MTYIRHRAIMIGVAVLILALAGGTVFAATRQPSGATAISSGPSPTPVVLQSHLAGVGTTEITNEGLAVTLVQIVKHGPRWLFQFQIKNIVNTTLTVRGAGQVHQFIISGVTQAAPYNGVAQLGSPAASEIAANYPDLATTLPSGGAAQGWLAVDTTNLGFTPSELLYRYAAVPATGCTDPTVPSTCQTDTLYQALSWYLI